MRKTKKECCSHVLPNYRLHLVGVLFAYAAGTLVTCQVNELSCSNGVFFSLLVGFYRLGFSFCKTIIVYRSARPSGIWKPRSYSQVYGAYACVCLQTGEPQKKRQTSHEVNRFSVSQKETNGAVRRPLVCFFVGLLPARERKSERECR